MPKQEEKIVLKTDKDLNNNTIKIGVEKPKKQITPVVQATTGKKTMMSKIKDVFIGTDGNSVADYALYDVIVPALKLTIWEVVTGGLDMSLFDKGEAPRNIHRNRGNSYYNYNRGQGQYIYSKEPDYRGYGNHPHNSRRGERPERRTSTPLEFDDILLPSRSDAELVISMMGELIDQYGSASISDLYELVGMTPISTDNNWGWENLEMAYSTPVSGGYMLRLPRPKALV